MQADKDIEKKIKKLYAKPQKLKLMFPAGFGEVALAEAQSILTSLWYPQKFIPQCLLSKNEIVVSNIHIFSTMELLLRSKTIFDIRLILLETKIVGKHAFANKCANLDWDLFLNKNMLLTIKVKSIASINFHETGLKQILISLLQDRVKEVVEGNTLEATGLYADFNKNKLTLSISLAGDALYKRGYRPTLSASAPLREDIAACCIQKVLSETVFQPTQVIIPFAGTGTFAFEILLMQFNISNFFRKYAIQTMPFFNEKAFNYLIKKSIEHIITGFETITYCIDTSQSALDICLQNLQQLKQHLASIPMESQFSIRMFQEDFLKMKIDIFESVDGSSIFIPLNPPYGIRLNRTTDIGNFYEKIALKINEISNFCPRMLGFILCPSEITWTKFRRTLRKMETKTYHFNQGGLDIRVCQFKNFK